MKTVDLSGLLSETTNFGEDILGPAEYRVLSDARLLLYTPIPTEGDLKASYLSHSAQTQAELINLSARIGYIRAMKISQRDETFGKLLDDDGYSVKDRASQAVRHTLAVSRDSSYRDMCETVSVLDVIEKMIDSLLWSIKSVFNKV
jgi:hypothetical protein